ncbi:alpha/beta hydrolase [Blastopirellula marina]|uniref:Lipase n=1 Tax=Blastopirellula marina TaxID=124 RepID=A0A2S8G913_9BACT|nr:alpha/beta hydrolase [Blastopirellula marina]PQO40952.1 lipase [Blastopirellula marina]PTL45834.1 alpha/beta hydrolase [Blastopirellula marina]
MLNRRSISLLVLFFAMVSALQAAPPTGQPHVYKKVDGRELKLYVTKPGGWQKSDRRPAIIFFHGGGWVGGAPGQFTEHSKYLAERGMVAVQIEYRLLDRKSTDPPTVCIEDALDAMRWVRSHSDELGIDPNRVAAAGGSAGGHLAAYLGTVSVRQSGVSTKPNAMVLFNPVYDNGPGGWGTQRVKDRYPEFSPAHNISEDDPPHIVFLGSKDKLIPVATAQKFQQDMQDAGVRSELRIYEDQGHGFFNHGRDNNRWYDATIGETDKFLTSLGWLSQRSE